MKISSPRSEKMNLEFISRVSVLAVGVEKYQHMRPLFGPSSDIGNIRRILVSSSTTALFNDNQFVELHNPTSNELRSQINNYILGRSALGDVLVFYFSGHGVSIGSTDFGFCTVDTIVHPGSDTVLPLTVVTFSDLLRTLSVMGVIPVVIIDACYSGAVGNTIVSPNDAINNLHQGIQKSAASNYALLCSCAEFQSSLDSPQGGVFSQFLFDVIGGGVPSLNRGASTVSIKDVYRPIVDQIEQSFYDTSPRLYVGDTFSDFPIAKNVLFSPQSYSFVGHLKCVIDVLWNGGNERELSPREILDLCGQGAYGNHQKLSLDPWALVENSPGSKNRRLTERGRLFAQGQLEIPRTVEKDPNTEIWQASPNSAMVDINSS
jgi:hypothetical protein